MRCLLAALALLLSVAGPAAAQFPAELRGQVTDALTAAPVEAAYVELPALGRGALTDATGAFRLRGLEPGAHPVVVRRLGYQEWRGMVELQNGRVARVEVALAPAAIGVAGVEARAARGAGDGTRIGRAELAGMGARTAGDALRAVPGVVVRGQGAERQQTVSIRGSGPEAVLVLVDGVPINDPVTGAADLSTVPAHAIESITVLVGARSARYGPRAEAGVVLIETRTASDAVVARASLGSLGERGFAAEAGRGAGGWSATAGGHLREVDGRFAYERVPGVDPTPVERVNADAREIGGYAAAFAPLAGGELRLRLGAEALRRGLPGMGYAPSPEARQSLDRARGALAWRRDRATRAAGVSLSAVSQRVHFADPVPPFGLPYDAVTRVGTAELRTELDLTPRGSRLRGVGVGSETRLQGIRSDNLAADAPRSRLDAGLFAHGLVGDSVGQVALELAAEARVDHDDLAGRRYLNHAVTARAAAGGLAFHLANRSGYSPPSLGDQFFREGVAVAPNPALRPERVPSEWEFGGSAAGHLLGAEIAAGGRAFRGDVRGMIVWLPDFRFVWSPRNTDVNRRGAEGWGELALPARDLRFRASYGLAAITYDRPGDDAPVQVAYRPRHSAQLRAEWAPGAWRLAGSALLTGRRNPAPARINELPAFWTLDLDLAREWALGRSRVTTSLHTDRLFDEKHSMIFGFPEAGRRIRLDVQVRLADHPPPR